ncbi:MAG: tetratricopeptide repeat protein [Bacteroides sp.]
MDKYEYKVRLQEIKDLIAKGEYVEAASIADTIDWTKVKSVMMLCTISDLYKINRRLEDARDLLLLAYDRYPGGRSIVYSLCELFIKMGDVVQAVEYYKEFVQIAPKDTGRYILQYKLYEAQDVSIEERIEVLKELKSKEYIEKWAYELAYLYHRIGLATKCVEECDELILWFGEGRYVMKAMELKMLHEPLTPSQEEKYAEMKGEIVRQKAAEEAGEVYPETPEEEKPEEEVDESPTKEILTSDPDDIQVKVMNVGQYDTINMQKELAANMKELWDQKTDKEPEAEGDTDLQETKRLDSLADALEDFTMAETKVIETDAVKEALNQSEEQGEVFFGETSEMTPVSAEESSAEITEETLEQPMEAPVQSGQSTVPEAAAPKAEEKQEEEPQEEEPQEEEPQTVVLPAREIEEHINAQPVMKPRIAATIDPHKPLPEGMEKMLGMEYDGQISMVVPEAEQVEKQITGQISLEDVLAEWERVKKENEQKRMEEVQQHILQQTGAMFTEFEAATRDGLLEKLEKGKTIPSDEVEELEEYYEPAQEDGEDYEEPAEQDEFLDESYDDYEEPVENTEEYTEESEAIDADTEAEEEPNAAAADTEAEEEPDAADADTEEEEEVDAADAEAAGEAAEEAVDDTAAEKAGTEEPDAADTEAEEEADTADADTEVGEEADATEAAAEAVEDDVKDAETDAKGKKAPGQKKGKPVRKAGKEQGRRFTAEEKELFGSYLQNKHTREQILNAIDKISLAAYTGNIILTGEEGMDTLTLAKKLMKEVQQTDSNFSGKIAKISSESLNKKGIAPVFDRIVNGALIIQKANKLSDDSVKDMQKVMNQEHKGMIVILEDTRGGAHKLLKKHPELKELFNIEIHVEALDNDSLVSYGRKYAEEQEYGMDEMGVLALHTCIAERQTIDHIVTIEEVKDIIDDAIQHANRKTLGHFFDIIVAKRYDEEDRIILRENDFR